MIRSKSNGHSRKPEPSKTFEAVEAANPESETKDILITDHKTGEQERIVDADESARKLSEAMDDTIEDIGGDHEN